jgi:ElaB/YqjD/DUF883 family membrane-anchored ribosome-binding protein
MRQAKVREQVKAAIHNVESALQDLSDRLDTLPGNSGRRRSRVRRAGRRLRRTAGTFAENVPIERASAIAADTGRTVRQHPLTTALTAAIAGYLVWSLVRYSTEHTQRAREGLGERIDRGEDELRKQAESMESERHARH